MKKVILSMMSIIAVTVIGCKNETKSNANSETNTTIVEGKEMSVANFGVRGNCGMCKTTIEKAANSLEGVASANWDVDKKRISVSYDESKVSENDLHKVIANAGYDTEKMAKNETAYKDLPKCCKYDADQQMNQ